MSADEAATLFVRLADKIELAVQHPALIEGDSLPEYWCRVGADGSYYLFLAQPLSKDLKYPVYSGQSIMKQSVVRELTLNVNGKTIQHKFLIGPDDRKDFLNQGDCIVVAE